MSLAAMTWAFGVRGVTPTEKVVLLALADYSNDDGESWPGQVKLAEKCDLSERTIRNTLNSLNEKGLVGVEERRRPDGYRTSNRYLLGLQISPATSAGEPDLTGKIPQSHRQTVAGQEPSVEPSVNTPPTPSADEQFDALFDEVWSHWPNKNGKAVAKKKWRGAVALYRKTPMFTEGGGQSLADVVRKFGKAYRQTTPPRFIPMLATWLNQERWHDPLPVDQTRGAYSPEPLAQTPIDDSPYDGTGALNIPRGMKAQYDDDGRFERFVPLGE